MRVSTTGNKTHRRNCVADFRTAKVFENHGIDFCCDGKIALAATCAEKDSILLQ